MDILSWTDAQKKAIATLQQGAYVVTCAHQPHWLGGPLFLLHKLLFLIQIARALQARMGKPVIPLFWIHDDDHDWRELAHLPDLRTRWTPSEPGRNQPFGCYSAKQIFSVYRDELQGVVGKTTSLGRDLLRCWEEGSVSEAFLRFWQEFLGQTGLLFVRAEFCRDYPFLRRLFTEHVLSARDRQIMLERWRATRSKGFAPLLRDVFPWMFVIVDGRRERVVRLSDRHFAVGAYQVSDRELIQKVEQGEWLPSPGAGLRPIWQEAICRSLWFVGGPSEIAYWLEMQPLMTRYDVAMPGMCLRDVLLFVDETQWRWITGKVVPPEMQWLRQLEATLMYQEKQIPDSTQARSLSRLLRRMHSLIHQAEQHVMRSYAQTLGVPQRQRDWLWQDRQRSTLRWLARFSSWDEVNDILDRIIQRGSQAIAETFSFPGMQIHVFQENANSLSD